VIAEFAQIVGLLSAFSSGRSAKESGDLTEFLTWLTEHNHSELREAIEKNYNTSISIKAILNLGFESVHTKLDAISTHIAILSSRSEGVEELATSYATTAFSEQAIEILKLMDKNKASFFLLSNEIGTKDQRLVLDSGPNYICTESQFFHDDLSLMVSLGLLLQDYNSQGDPLFRYTRAASNLVKGIRKL